MRFGRRSRVWARSVMGRVRRGRARRRLHSIMWSGCVVRYRACRSAGRRASDRGRERNKDQRGQQSGQRGQAGQQGQGGERGEAQGGQQNGGQQGGGQRGGGLRGGGQPGIRDGDPQSGESGDIGNYEPRGGGGGIVTYNVNTGDNKFDQTQRRDDWSEQWSRFHRTRSGRSIRDCRS